MADAYLAAFELLLLDHHTAMFSFCVFRREGASFQEMDQITEDLPLGLFNFVTSIPNEQQVVQRFLSSCHSSKFGADKCAGLSLAHILQQVIQRAAPPLVLTRTHLRTCLQAECAGACTGGSELSQLNAHTHAQTRAHRSTRPSAHPCARTRIEL
eukprot:6182326-Pleurochrysis_carterae.AAC.2